MKYTATVTRDADGYSAQCVEVQAIGEGSTLEAALASLRAELEDRLEHVEGVAPPARPVRAEVELVVVDEARASNPGAWRAE